LTPRRQAFIQGRFSWFNAVFVVTEGQIAPLSISLASIASGKQRHLYPMVMEMALLHRRVAASTDSVEFTRGRMDPKAVLDLESTI